MLLQAIEISKKTRRFLWRGVQNNGFTYIEVMVALAIGGLVVALTAESFQQGTAWYSRWARQSEKQEIETAFSFFRQDFRCAFIDSKNSNFYFSGRMGSSGINDTIDFFRTDGNPDEFGKVTYFVRPDVQTREPQLWRRYQPFHGNSHQQEREEIFLLGNVQLFRIEYFEGERWVSSWGWDTETEQPTRGIRGLPLLVRIRVEWQGASLSLQTRECIFPLMLPMLNVRSHV